MHAWQHVRWRKHLRPLHACALHAWRHVAACVAVRATSCSCKLLSLRQALLM
jgi:hypothetical protein